MKADPQVAPFCSTLRRAVPRIIGVAAAGLILLPLLSGCATLGRTDHSPPQGPETPTPQDDAYRAAIGPVQGESSGFPYVLEPVARPERIEDEPLIEMTPGSGRFFDTERASRWAEVDRSEGLFTLNFEGADLQEVVHFVLGHLLEENYLLHPAVSGRVTLQTSRPLERQALLPTLEDLLRLNGATLVTGEDGLYRVLPRDGALQGTTVPRTQSVGPGLNVRIVPLQFIAAAEMVKILEPFLTPDALVRVDGARNLLILSGSRRELSQWQETIEIFDVDWLQGMSVGLFTLRNADVDEVISELERVTDADSGTPLAGLFHLIPIPRLNAVMVITPQARFLEEAKVWISRLDRTRDLDRTRLHVYRMQHGRADQVAELLADIYGGEVRARAASPEAELAPGMEPVEIGNGSAARASGESAREVLEARLGNNGGKAGSVVGDVRILADESNNALLIMASERDFSVLERALRQIDIPRLQVLVDATIIEVSLTDDLRYGLQWFFTNQMGDYQGRGILADSADLARTFPGFNYSIVDSASQVRAVLSALARDSRVNVLSSPSVMVLDNQEAVIRVGDQVPIRTSETTSVVTDSPVTVSSIQLRDTGVNLRVTPRVNAGGMVLLEIEQEVNDVTTTTTSNIDSPTIQQRLIRSAVSVQSGDTIVLGGLIRETTGRDQSGVPGLYRLPVVGALFGTTSFSTRRTELVVLLTPRVAQDAAQARLITEEFRSRMRGLEQRVRDDAP